MPVHSIWDKCGYMIHVDVRIAGSWTGATVGMVGMCHREGPWVNGLNRLWHDQGNAGLRHGGVKGSNKGKAEQSR